MEGTNKFDIMLSNSTAFTSDNYFFQVLGPQHAQQALQLLSTEFQRQEPLGNAFYRLFPNKRWEDHHNQEYFWKLFEQDYLNNGISVGCFDMNNKYDLVGISVSKDLSYTPEGFDEQFMDNLNYMSAIIKLQEELMTNVAPGHRQILNQTGVVMDIWGVAIQKKHTGKQILHKMLSLNEKLRAKKNYQYFLSFTTNFKTGVALTKRKFQKISTLDARQFTIDGAKVYQQLDLRFGQRRSKSNDKHDDQQPYFIDFI